MRLRSRGPIRASQCWRPLAVVLCAIAVALTAQEPSRSADAQQGRELAELSDEELAKLSDEELAAAGAIRAPYQVDDVPYATRVFALFTGLARRDDVGLRGWARTHGMDPAGAAVQDLRALALQVEREYPMGTTAQEAKDLQSGVLIDEETFQRSLRERQDERYRALGVAFGQWLQQRSQEGYPPEFLIERLLSSPHLAVGAASTDSMEALEASLLADARAFEDGLKTVVDTVPRQFVTQTRKEH